MAIKIPGLPQLHNPQTLGLMVTAAAVAALLGGAWMWSQTPDYRAVYANVSDRDGGAIVAALQQMNVPYKLSDGVIQVPAGQVHEARLRLAGLGLPKGSVAGFELMENPKLGTSQFLEQVNYQRALEGELARSVQFVSAVQSARVHLALTKPSVFMREQQKPSASVLLNLHPGRTLDPAQVGAIVHLVSSSVPDLPIKNVTVVDQNGNLLSDSSNLSNHALDTGQLKYVQELEGSYAKRIEAILAPIVGTGNVRAQVTAEVDFSRAEQAEEIYNPNSSEPVIRSQQSSESTSSNGQQVTGVPGALSNQPPAPASAQVNTSVPTSDAPAPQMSGQKNMMVNYEVGKTIRHVRQESGNIKRLSTAVVVNHRQITDAKGKVSLKPLSENEMAQINNLVKEAMGYNKERGDTLNVVNSPFNTPAKEIIPEIPFWKSPDNIDLAKEIGKHALIAAMMLYLMLGVLRPAMRTMRQARAQLPAVTGMEMQPEMLGAPAIQPAVTYENKLEMARQITRQEPKLVATVVKNWVAGDER